MIYDLVISIASYRIVLLIGSELQMDWLMTPNITETLMDQPKLLQ